MREPGRFVSPGDQVAVVIAVSVAVADVGAVVVMARRWPQDGPPGPPVDPNMASDGSQMAARWSEHGPNMAPSSPAQASTWAKMAST